ncbi:bile acid:sodium symporter family protein [Demequina sediminicola]|uniref:bile acid:sodium symporter family protein n=1 Tax=Demequina sediminicola TaxID=1095026 RepID=UPI00078040E6|nr:bile acid:sodium symporter [Demequina sediminicola]
MSDVLTAIAQVSILVFVVSSMIALGLSLTVQQILTPLKNARLVITGLVLSFIVAPAASWGIAQLFGLGDDQTLGLLLLGVAAGAPFLPKLAHMAKGDVPYSVGLMVLLMVVTVIYIPLVLPLLVDGVEVSAWDIAKPLVLLMLLPLILALIVRGRYPESANLAPRMNQISSTGLAIGLGAGILVALPSIWDQIGTGLLLATIVFVVLLLIIGYFTGGSTREHKVVTSLGTTQRNLSAALLIAGTSFIDTPTVLVAVMVASLLLTAALLLTAGEMGKRAKPSADAATSDAN